MVQTGSAILDNLHFLKQAHTLVSGITPEQFVYRNPSMYNSGMGPHLRHCLDHYQLFLEGWESGRIDYDRRLRDPDLESNRDVMLERISDLIEGFSALTPESLMRPLEIKMDCGSESLEPFSQSSVLRELQFLISHTVHHFALVAMILCDQKLPVPEHFGVAPSTIKYKAGESTCAQ